LNPENRFPNPDNRGYVTPFKPVLGMTLRAASIGQPGEGGWLFGSGSRLWGARTARLFRGEPRHKIFPAIFTLLLATSLLATAESTGRISFRIDVMAVLSKAGCNAGQCHGNANGKAGFKLSLRGQDPDWDYNALTRDMFGRRTDPEAADQSLILLKPTTQIAHEGGQRFKQDSEEYQILRAWIAEGMPSDPPNTPTLERLEVSPTEKILFEPAAEIQLRARAFFSDGSDRDVTRMAVYNSANSLVKVTQDGRAQHQGSVETTVLVRFLHAQVPVRLAFMPARPGFVWNYPPANNYLDEAIFAKLRLLRINPSDLCSDSEFIRRAYLDLLGILPTAEEARAFVNEEAVPPPMNGPNVRQVLECASPRALSGRSVPVKKRQRAGALQDAAARSEGPGVNTAGFGRAALLEDLRRQLQKRALVIDQLLERPEFADFWALKWADLLRAEERLLDRKGIETFHRWIRQSVAQNKPLDQFARELIAARGSTYYNPAANFYRAIREPVARAEAVAQVFLGTQLRCAQCHNHPFDKWTQDDYYDWAEVFARLNYKVLENRRRDSNDGHEFKGEQIVYVATKGEVKNPRSGTAAHPRFLGETSPMTLSPEESPGEPTPNPSEGGERIPPPPNKVPLPGGARGGLVADELDALADWVTSPNNPFFARAQVNRVWFHLMGRGIVDPIDDFRATNPPSHPTLLDSLAADFVKHKFDLRYVIRLIMNSRAYQLSAMPNDSNRDDDLNFSRAYVRRLTAEQLLDCQSAVTGVPVKFNGYPPGLRAAQLPGALPERKRDQKMSEVDHFLETFGKPPRLLTCECERSGDTTMGQAFQMISGPAINDLLAAPDNRLAQLLKGDKSNQEIIEELYWTALTRPPTEKESNRATALLDQSQDKRRALEDVTWALLNAKEFVLRK